MNLIIFDLDGTLIDSKLDLAHSVNATRAHMDLPPMSPDLIYSYVGNGAPILIRRAMGDGVTEEQIAHALEYFISYYHEHCLDSTTLYPGVLDTLATLHSRGKPLAVLTNKPIRISKHILDGLGVEKLLARIYGGNSFPEKKPNPVGIETLRAEFPATAEKTLMVGDSAVDVLTARNAGVRSCGVTFGFQPETLKEAPPDFVIDRMEELLAIVTVADDYNPVSIQPRA